MKMGLRWVVMVSLGWASAAAADDLWEGEPIRYSSGRAEDPASKLGDALNDGSLALPEGGPLERLRWVLGRLQVPEESQVLVFSKTSKQNNLIGPSTPRALYFSEDTYVGYVPGGSLEIVSFDALLGPVFHVISPAAGAKAVVSRRETGECLSCHGTARTLGVPGLLVRSVFPAEDGRPLLALGSTDVDDTTPVGLRWGGYYVTGRSALSHFGNRVFTDDRSPEPSGSGALLGSVADRIDASRYPRATSDIVALLLLEHQCRVTNLITAASHRLRRETWMRGVLNLGGMPSQVSATDAAAIADALLFRDAATLGDGVEGDEAFQTAFARRFPVTRDGRSLADFHLGSRLFKSRCSYMVYSRAFASMPAALKSAVTARLREILRADGEVAGYEYLKASERRRIDAILLETLPAYAGG